MDELGGSFPRAQAAGGRWRNPIVREPVPPAGGRPQRSLHL